MTSNADTGVLVPSKKAQAKILELARSILEEHKQFEQYRDKMEAIDVAYARYNSRKTTEGTSPGQGIDVGNTPLGVVDMPSTTPPVLVSQVDSMTAYLADVFLSGSPLFPVVTTPANKKQAEQLEAALDDHAILGGYARQLLLFFKDGIKYNVSALEVDWSSISQFSQVDIMERPGEQKLQKDRKSMSKLKRLDMYNTVWDYNSAPGDIAEEGDYAGYIELKSLGKLRRMLQRLSDDKEAFNIKEAKSSGYQQCYYRTPPQVSDYITARKNESTRDYAEWMGEKAENTRPGNNFEVFTFYARVAPADLGITAPMPNTSQIWKFVIVNNSVVVQAKRIISAFDYLPILFGQPLEDGLGYQTQSIAESSIPFQQAAETLFNITFNSARRAVSDRALYDPSLISPSDVNAPVAPAKIPVKTNAFNKDKSIRDAYHQIPFDSRGTEGAIQSGMQIVSFGKELSGLNAPMRGQFQAGNKSVREWEDTMGGADARLRLPALTLESQVFSPLKNILKMNLLQYGEDAVVTNQKTGDSVNVNIQELRAASLAFRLADGYTPKSKLASTQTIEAAMQMISQSPVLAEVYGQALPGMFTHLMQLAGVRGMEEYLPKQQQPSQEGVDPNAG